VPLLLDDDEELLLRLSNDLEDDELETDDLLDELTDDVDIELRLENEVLVLVDEDDVLLEDDVSDSEDELPAFVLLVELEHEELNVLVLDELWLLTDLLDVVSPMVLLVELDDVEDDD
jgi:hypothetical protein